MASHNTTVLVVGPGAMGCLLAGLFGEAGLDVAILDKDRERADRISADGIRIDDDRGTRVIPMKAHADATRAAGSEFVILCVKSYDTEAAIRSAAAAIGQRSIVVSFQNGVGNVEKIAAVTGNANTVGVVTSHGGTLVGIGHVRHAGRGTTQVAPMTARGRPGAERVAKTLRAAGIHAEAAGDLTSILWSKLVVNAAINPITATANVNNGQLLQDPTLHDTMRRAAIEAAEVAHAMGIRLSYPDAVARTEEVCRLTADNVSSMLQDVRRKRRTEIDAIAGAVVHAAAQVNVPVPTNMELLERVRALEAGYAV